ncbi:uncharacterized protein RCC_06029 [Ramularia collo-cygni]|uniref:Amidoligase enzyme n=1 Tax=Ramularia collo-cygni TaxID=112498 RepID=A0A2D3US97_9PEZI|nr:uncharacterized protein RCC_06029 [Ramularia collo-cygni]CZT20172.1 uncharacterized protein RCC_06029 [Ramularia collo-cygni]
MSTTTQQGPALPRASLKLTGGIEIECLLITSHTTEDRGHLRDDASSTVLAQNRVYQALRPPIRVVCVECKATFDYHLPLYNPKDPNESDYIKWDVSLDPSLDLSSEEKRKIDARWLDFHVAPIEIKSRVMLLTENFAVATSKSNPSHTHKITYREEIEAVYSRLLKSFNDPRSEHARDCRLVINKTASTHVHIGSSYNGFPLETVKNVMSVLVAHELQVDAVHSVDRITGCDRLRQDGTWQHLSSTSGCRSQTSIPAAYNQPWSAHFSDSAFKHYKGESEAQRLQRRTQSSKPSAVYPASKFHRRPKVQLAAQKCDIGSWLTLIECASSVQDLRRFQFGVAHSSTINLTNLKEHRLLAASHYSRWDGKMTIEFRQHGATLQSAEILNWIGVLVGLFKYANSTNHAAVKAACLKNWDNPAFTMLDLLKLFGYRAQDDIFRHYANVLGELPNRRPYSETIEMQALRAVDRFGPNDCFAPVMKHLIKSRAELTNIEKVRQLINRKFLQGGYGQFSKSYLDERIALEFGVPEYLILGFCPPWSSYETGEPSSDAGAESHGSETGRRTSVIGLRQV